MSAVFFFQNTYQHNYSSAALHVLEGSNSLLRHRHRQALAQMDFPGPSTRTSFLFRALHLAQRPLLFRQRRLKLGMGICLVKASLGKFGRCREEESLTKVLEPQFTGERQSCRRKQHLLPHWGGIRNVGDCREFRRGVVSSDDDVQCCIGLDVRLQRVQVTRKRGCRGHAGNRYERLLFDADQQSECRG